MHARSLIRIINCHALKQIAQHGNKLKRIQNGRKIRTDHERIRNGSKTDNEILLNGNGSFFGRIPYVRTYRTGTNFRGCLISRFSRCGSKSAKFYF